MVCLHLKHFSLKCALPSVKSLDDPRFDPRLSSSVLHNWKKSLRKLVWEKDMTQDLLSCLQPVKKNEIISSLLMDFETFLIKLEPLDVDKHKMETRMPFRLEFANHGPLEADVKEEAVLEATQRQVGQSNSTLEDRTLVDWSMARAYSNLLGPTIANVQLLQHHQSFGLDHLIILLESGPDLLRGICHGPHALL